MFSIIPMTFSSQIKDFLFFLTTCPKSSAWDQEIKPWSLLCAFTAKKALQLWFTSERFVINLFCTSVKYLLHHSLDTWIHSCTWGCVSCWAQGSERLLARRGPAAGRLLLLMGLCGLQGRGWRGSSHQVPADHMPHQYWWKVLGYPFFQLHLQF